MNQPAVLRALTDLKRASEDQFEGKLDTIANVAYHTIQRNLDPEIALAYLLGAHDMLIGLSTVPRAREMVKCIKACRDEIKPLVRQQLD